MRIKEVNVYTYGELSETAKDNVKQWLNEDCFELTDQLETELSDYYVIPHAELSYSLSSCQGDGVSFTGQWTGEEMRLMVYDAYEGNVPPRLAKILPYFTLKFTRNSRHYAHAYTVQTELYSNRYYGKHIEKIIADAEKVIDSWRINICNDLEKTGYAEIDYTYTDEYVSETCEANGYEFYEDGDIA